MLSKRILIVEDEAVVALDLRVQLEDMGYSITGVAASGEAAIAAVLQNGADLVLMDVRLQGEIDGIEAAAQLRRASDTPVIFLTAHNDALTVERAAQTAPYGFVTKPFQPRELRAGIEVALAKHRLERQLQEADRWFAHTLRCVHDGIVLVEPDRSLRFMNPAAEVLTGWTQEEAFGRQVEDLLSFALPDEGAKRGVQQALARALGEGRPFEMGHAMPLLARGGHTVYVDGSAAPVRDDNQLALGAVLVLRDAAPRMAQETALRISESRFRAAFDHAPLGMVLVSLTGDLLQVNAAFCHLLGAPRDALVGRDLASLSLAPELAHERQRLRELGARLPGTTQPAGVVQFEKPWLRLDGQSAVWTLCSVSLMQEDGAAAAWLYQVHDLTEQKRAAEQLAELASERLRREASEMANRAKSEFLSRVSHEMRTPLNAVLGFAQLLQMNSGAGAAKVDAYAGQIRTAGEHMLQIVSDLLDLQRAAQGDVKVELADVPLAPVLALVHQLLATQAQAQGISVDIVGTPGLMVRADPTRLKQVLLNLGSNAIKYNRPQGLVQVRAEALVPVAGAAGAAVSHAAAGAGEGAPRVVITVRDEGIGMTPEQLAHLFEPFQRLGREHTGVPGTGLGLVISRSLVTSMGGTLEVQSQPRVGTLVRLELDAVVAAPA